LATAWSIHATMVGPLKVTRFPLAMTLLALRTNDHLAHRRLPLCLDPAHPRILLPSDPASTTADMAAHATGGRGPSMCSKPMTISHAGSFSFDQI
jgi:hypothetical protein